MDEQPDYAKCSVEIEFGDGTYTFALPLKMVAELQDIRKAPIGLIYARVFRGEYYAEDLIETCRLGLIGGGQMNGARAKDMVDRYTDQWPMEVWLQHAMVILAACIVGYRPLDAGAEKKTTDDADEPTTSRGSTSAEP